MRILIDMDGIQTAPSGDDHAGRYSRSLFTAMLKNPGRSEISLLFNAQFGESFRDLRRFALNHIACERIYYWQSPAPQSIRSQSVAWRAALADILRDDVIAAAHPDVLHWSSLDPGQVENIPDKTNCHLPTGACLYDPTFLVPPVAPFPAGARDLHHAKIRKLNSVRLLFTVSEAARREALSHLSLDPERVVSIGVGVSETFFVSPVTSDQERHIRERHGLLRPFVLYRGGFGARDNVGCLIEAFAAARQSLPEAHDLVLVGSLPPAEKIVLWQLAARHGIPAENLKWLGPVGEQEYLDLLRTCAVCVYPPHGDWMGLPVLEAMAAGARVLCSDLASLQEVTSRTDILFDPSKSDSMASALVKVLTGTLGVPSAAENQAHAKKFSWSSCSGRVIEAYGSLHDEFKPRGSQVIVPPLGKLVRRLVGRAPADLQTREISALAAAIVANRPSCSPPRLLLDATVQSRNKPSSGIGRVVDRITAELLKRPPQELAVTPVRADEYLHHYRIASRYGAFLRGETFVGDDELVELRRGDHFLALDLNHAIESRGAFAERVRQVGGRLSALVYDLLPMQRPDWFPIGFAETHGRWFDAVAKYDDLICISRTVAEDVKLELDRRLPKSRQPRVSWFHLGCELPVTPLGELPKQLSERPTVLLVSLLWRRKGHEQTLDAFEQLWKDGFEVNLAFAGRVGWGVEKLVNRLVNHPEKERRLFWFNGPDDGLLGQLYAQSTGVLVASEGEGFGLPVVEALAHKRPVLARDLAIFREIAGDRITYFRADHSDQLAHAVRDWIQDISRGTISGEFPAPLGWPQSATQLLAALGLKQS